MATLRPQSLSGLLSAALLLIVLPLTAALVYGGIKLRDLSRASDVLVRDSIMLTQHTQVLFQDIYFMERALRYFGILEDPGLVDSFKQHHAEFTERLRQVGAFEAFVPPSELERVRSAGEQVASLMRESQPLGFTAELTRQFEVLNNEATRLSENSRAAVVARLDALEREAAATQQGLLWAIMAVVPAALVIAGIFWFFVIRPLRAMDRAISDLGRGAFSRAIAISGPADLAALGRQLEWLRTRLLDIAVERNRFLRHMSHELKTPLANIREGTDLLLDGAVGPMDDNQREVTGILRENAIRLQQLIENLLSYSAWKSRASSVDLSGFRLSSLVDRKSVV